MQRNRYHHLSWLHGIEIFEAAFGSQSFARHAHAGFAIGAIAEGVGGYFCRGETMLLPRGSLSLMNPEEAHTGHAATDWLRYNMLYVSEKAVRQILSLRHLRGFTTVAPMDRGWHLSRALGRLVTHLNAGKDADWHLRVEEAVHEVLAQCFTCHGCAELRAPGEEPKAIRRLRELIAAGVESGAALGLADLAAEVELNPSYLIRSTRRQTGLTPHGLVVRARLEQAHRLMLDKLPAAEAALEAGFCDQAHMIRQYRRHFGVTPARVQIHS